MKAQEAVAHPKRSWLWSLLQGLRQPRDVPAVPRRQDAGARAIPHASIPNDFKSIASSVRPLEYTRPVVPFIRVTCAGLKSSGSIA